MQKLYLNEKRLKLNIFEKDLIWFDTGTIESLNLASSFIQSIEKRHGITVGSIEEACFNQKLITKKEFIKFLNKNSNIEYYKNIKKIIQKK